MTIDKFGRRRSLKKQIKLKKLESKINKMEKTCLDLESRLDELFLHLTILQANVNTIESERILYLEKQLALIKNQLYTQI